MTISIGNLKLPILVWKPKGAPFRFPNLILKREFRFPLSLVKFPNSWKPMDGLFFEKLAVG